MFMLIITFVAIIVFAFLCYKCGYIENMDDGAAKRSAYLAGSNSPFGFVSLSCQNLAVMLTNAVTEGKLSLNFARRIWNLNRCV